MNFCISVLRKRNMLCFFLFLFLYRCKVFNNLKFTFFIYNNASLNEVSNLKQKIFFYWYIHKNT